MGKAAERLIRTLEAHDVEYVFGVCGDTSVGLYRHLNEVDHELTHVLSRDERSSSFMADAYARLSGKPGVCEGPSGGGATYLIPGLAEANDSSVPVIGFNTTTPVRYRGRGVLTELDQEALFDPVTSWNASVDHSEQVPRKVREAFRQATAGRPGAVHLSFPMDILNGKTEASVYADDDTAAYPAYRPEPEAKRVARAAEVLEESDRPVVVAGGGVHSSACWEQLRTFAERFGVPVAQTLTSVGCIGDSPYSIGVIGENGYREYANEILDEADALFLFGTAVESVWTKKWSAPADGEKTVVHVDIDATAIGRNYETAVSVPGDLKRVLGYLLDVVETDQKWDAAAIEARHKEWLAPFADAFDDDEFPIRPERMVAETQAVLDDDAVLISDPGTSCPYFAALYQFPKPGRHWVTPRAHGALGYTIPGVVGAHYARPESTIVGFTGDGSVGTCLGELETLDRLGLPVTIVVVNNGGFSWIEAGQNSYADFSFGVEFDQTNYASIAADFGITSYRVESAAEYRDALESAVDLDEPLVIDLPTRPLPTIENVPVDWLEPSE